MIFHYKMLGTGIYMPIIPIGYGNDNGYGLYEVLVDSGSSYNYFDSQMGEIIGIDIKTGHKGYVQGVTGYPQEAYFHTLKLTVDNCTIQTSIGFIENLKFPYGIVGQNGFFNKFNVEFNYLSKIININPHLKVN